jgi:hypothetical protein
MFYLEVQIQMANVKNLCNKERWSESKAEREEWREEGVREKIRGKRDKKRRRVYRPNG